MENLNLKWLLLYLDIIYAYELLTINCLKLQIELKLSNKLFNSGRLVEINEVMVDFQINKLIFLLNN